MKVLIILTLLFNIACTNEEDKNGKILTEPKIDDLMLIHTIKYNSDKSITHCIFI